MRKLLVFLLFVCASASAQTTFILVRHAEKENVKDNPNLTAEGRARAQSLVSMLDKQKVDAIFSTDYNRTKSTVQPLAEAKGISLQTYKDINVEELISKYKTVVVCGHSNTIPALANTLLGSKQFADFAETDYGNILIITATAPGKATVTHLRY